MTWDVHAAAQQPLSSRFQEDCQLHLVELPDKDDEVSAATRACLSDEDKQRAARFVRAVDAHRYMAAHAALRVLLAPACLCTPRDVPMTTREGGKPTLMMASPALHFNLTHSDNWALIALHPHWEIGVDLEMHKPWPHMNDLAESVFSQAELRTWRATTPADQASVLYTAWTRKEACLKAVGTGLITPPDQVELGLAPTPARGQWHRPEGGGVEWLDLDHLPLAVPHSACLAWIRS